MNIFNFPLNFESFTYTAAWLLHTNEFFFCSTFGAPYLSFSLIIPVQIKFRKTERERASLPFEIFSTEKQNFSEFIHLIKTVFCVCFVASKRLEIRNGNRMKESLYDLTFISADNSKFRCSTIDRRNKDGTEKLNEFSGLLNLKHSVGQIATERILGNSILLYNYHFFFALDESRNASM